MPLHSSKKIKTPKKGVNQNIQEILIQAFTNPQSQNKPPSLVMQNFRTKADAQGYSTPTIKKSKGNVVKVVINPPPIIKRIGASCDFSNIKRKLGKSTLVLKIQVQSKYLKIHQITQNCVKMCQKRLLVDRQMNRFLESMKDHEQIIKKIRKNAEEIEDIKEMIMLRKKKRHQIQLEVIQAQAKLMNVLKEKKTRKKDYENLWEKNCDLILQCEKQVMKNKSLHEKIKICPKQILINQKVPIFSKDLFDTIILQQQIQNSIQLNKMKSPSKIFKIKTNQIQNTSFNLCYSKNNHLFGNLPLSLIIICRLYIQMKLKNIEKVFFNKISYFCPQATKIFDFDTFKIMVKQFYVLTSPIGFEQQVIFTQSQTLQKQLKNSKSKLKQQNKKIQGDLILSSTCQCGNYFINNFNFDILKYLLQKYNGICIRNITKNQSCSILFLEFENKIFQRKQNSHFQKGKQTAIQNISFENSMKKQVLKTIYKKPNK